MVSEVHVQEIWLYYNHLVEWCKQNPKPMLMLTVQKNGNFGWTEHKEEIITLYSQLKTVVDNPFGLHVHHTRGRAFAPYSYQYELIKYGKELLKEIGIPINDHTSGWSQNNEDTVKACYDVGIMNFHYRKGRTFPLPDGMMGIPYRRIIHDKQIAERMKK